MRSFINGIVFTLALLLAAFIAGVWFGVLPSGADAKQLPLEDLAARRSLHASIARDTEGVNNPLQPSDANLLAGIMLYGANCAMCHGAADAKPSNLAQGFYIASPQLAKDGVEDDPESETHWKLVHGIRFTAMPAFKTTLSDDDLWKITSFLKHMDKLPADVDAAWKRVPSVASSEPASGALTSGSPAPSETESPSASAQPSESPAPNVSPSVSAGAGDASPASSTSPATNTSPEPSASA